MCDGLYWVNGYATGGANARGSAGSSTYPGAQQQQPPQAQVRPYMCTFRMRPPCRAGGVFFCRWCVCVRACASVYGYASRGANVRGSAGSSSYPGAQQQPPQPQVRTYIYVCMSHALSVSRRIFFFVCVCVRVRVLACASVYGYASGGVNVRGSAGSSTYPGCAKKQPPEPQQQVRKCTYLPHTFFSRLSVLPTPPSDRVRLLSRSRARSLWCCQKGPGYRLWLTDAHILRKLWLDA